ncbi:hypothetical protein ACP70R_048033 [Stipagrostis hirtigluma subsp. patula]
MEARRFGFDPPLPAAYKFDPTDADLVAYYLLPRAVGLPNPHAHAVIDDDPASCPPWELLRRHGHAGSDHAFFFAPPRDPAGKGPRAKRSVPAGEYGAGGTWRGQKGQLEDLVLVRGGAGGGAEMRIRYKKFNLTYYSDDGGDKTTGWVMHEYLITNPPLRPAAVLARVKIADSATGREQKKAAAAAVQPAAPYQDQPGPSNYLAAVQPAAPYQDQPGPSNYLADVHAAGSATVSSNGEASSSGSHNDIAHHHGDNSGAAMVEAAGEGEDYYVVDDEGEDHYVDNINNYITQEDIGHLLVADDYNYFEDHFGGNGG